VGPLFFCGGNAEQYQNLLTHFISLLEENERNCWLQHGGVMAHSVNLKAALLQEFFGECIVGHGLWPQ
jgi:hypothetical protein